jgi:tryptophan synthase alpha chain
MNSKPPVARSIHKTFDALRERRKIGLLPFIPAGYPDLETTAQLLPALEAAGASAIEIGLPFSDPIADGPIIQEAFAAALAKKLKLRDVLDTVARTRASVSIPLIAMGSYSLVYRYGVERFFADAKAAGFDGLILPDLPPPEAQSICRQVQGAGLETILLVAPTTTVPRRVEIGELSTGFVYYLSVSGITGERARLPEDLAKNVTELKQLTGKPVCVGFGISTAQHVAELAGVADGAIVGSAIVKRMKQHEKEGAAEIARAVEVYCRELLSSIPSA